MKLSFIEVTNFRNLVHVAIDTSALINVFHGNNGSGKTSILETIHYLGLGRSFRSRNIRRLINQSADRFRIVGQLSYPLQSDLTVGVERSTDSATIKIGGQSASSLVELANLLPLQLINADSHLLLTSGPLPRRQFLDWGVFHVEPLFYSYWQRASRAIKQRNASLKTARSYADIAIWDEELEVCGTWLDEQRQRYLTKFQPLCFQMLQDLLDRDDFILHYSAGWPNHQPLRKTLEESFQRDRQHGYTHYGPQRCDLQLKLLNIAAVDILSQGQQKLAAYAMRLAQGTLLKQGMDKNCIFLIDDLPSELDPDKRERVMALLLRLETQIFVTGIEPETMIALASAEPSRTFHVERGSIT